MKKLILLLMFSSLFVGCANNLISNVSSLLIDIFIGYSEYTMQYSENYKSPGKNNINLIEVILN